MKQFIAKNRNAFAGIAACLLIGGVTLAFQDSPLVHLQDSYIQQNKAADRDTLPPDRKMTMKELDALAQNLDAEMKQVEAELKKINLSDIIREVEQSLKEANLDKISAEVEKSLKEVNLAEIEKEVKEALKDVKWDKIESDVKLSLSEAREAISRINTDAVKKAMEEAGRALDKARRELKAIDMNKIMDGAKEGIEKARTELRRMKAMFTEMEKDGLIDTKKGFDINFKDGSLYINGKKQPEQVTGKYRSYFSGENFSISIEKEKVEN